MSTSLLNEVDRARLRQVVDGITNANDYAIGYPFAKDFDYLEFAKLFGVPVINLGDAYVDGTYLPNTKEVEREVIDYFAHLFDSDGDHWGYVSHGGTESNLSGLRLGRRVLPRATLYCSAASHYSLAKSADILKMPMQVVDVQSNGEIDYDDLFSRVRSNAPSPAVVCANVGTTMTEAKDDVARIKEVLEHVRVDHFIHSDAALCAIPAAVLTPRHPFTFADGADSISFSIHKFPGAPFAASLELARASYATGSHISYIGSTDTTFSGARSGLAALMLWYSTKRWGVDGYTARALASFELADHTEKGLRETGWEVRRNPQSMTVVFPAPSIDIRRKYQLATELTDDRQWSHVVCVPGTKREIIDEFLAEMARHRPL